MGCDGLAGTQVRIPAGEGKRQRVFRFAAVLAIGLLFSHGAWAASADKNQAVVLELIESVFNAQSLKMVGQLVDSKVVHHANPRITNGIGGFRAHYAKIFDRFRTYKLQVHRITGDGDFVSVQGVLKGTTEGNNKINFAVADFYRLKNGKITDIWRVQQPIEK